MSEVGCREKVGAGGIEGAKWKEGLVSTMASKITTSTTLLILSTLLSLSISFHAGRATGRRMCQLGIRGKTQTPLSAACKEVLFVEMGWGNDGHGQDVTKAAVRAARNAIEFNSIPSIKKLVPGGYDAMKLDVILAVPPAYQEGLRLEEVEKVFPYGECHIKIQDGGMVAPSGIAIERLGDNGDDMVVVCCSVSVGY